MACPPNSGRQPCTPAHPGYIGDLPQDPSDAAAVELISQVPYIGAAAAALIGGQMLQGGPVCVEDDRKDLRSNWNKIIIAGAVFAGVCLVGLLLIFRK